MRPKPVGPTSRSRILGIVDGGRSLIGGGGGLTKGLWLFIDCAQVLLSCV